MWPQPNDKRHNHHTTLDSYLFLPQYMKHKDKFEIILFVILVLMREWRSMDANQALVLKLTSTQPALFWKDCIAVRADRCHPLVAVLSHHKPLEPDNRMGKKWNKKTGRDVVTFHLWLGTNTTSQIWTVKTLRKYLEMDYISFVFDCFMWAEVSRFKPPPPPKPCVTQNSPSNPTVPIESSLIHTW